MMAGMKLEGAVGLLAVAFAVAGCSCSSETSATAAGGTAAGADGAAAGGATGGSGGHSGDGGTSTGGNGGSPPAQCDGQGYGLRPRAIATCDGLGPGTEDCHFRIRFNQAQCCPEAPCDRLLVYWAGGNQTCDVDDTSFDTLLGNYADAGFVAACAQPYTTDTEGGNHPFHLEFDRMNRVMQAIRADAADLWDGSKLLIGGGSHGGTAPLVMIASRRALKDHAAVWTGATHTAVLLIDGISNPRTLEEWAGSTTGCGLFHARYVGRYNGGSGPLVHSCSNDKCYCSTPTGLQDWAMDTTVIGAQNPTSPYTCSDFEQNGATVPYRFVSCGGAGKPACSLLGDIVPDEQQLLAQQALSNCSGIDATYQDYPDCSHILCGGFTGQCGGVDSLAWLATLGW